MTKKILMVDDEPDILKVIKFRLIKQGYEVIWAMNGQEGIDMTRTQKPDLVIMDYRMPVLNGLEASRTIKSDPTLRHIPILFMTASSGSITKEIIKAAGVDECIHKPFEAQEFLEKIEGCINKR